MVVVIHGLAHVHPRARAARSHKDLAASGPVAVEVASRRQATVGGRDRLVEVHREVAVHGLQRLGSDRFQRNFVDEAVVQCLGSDRFQRKLCRPKALALPAVAVDAGHGQAEVVRGVHVLDLLEKRVLKRAKPAKPHKTRRRGRGSLS